MKRNILAVTALVALAASLAACHDSQPVQQQAQQQPQYQQAPQPQYQQAQQPQVIEQPAQPQVIVQQQPQVVYAAPQQPQVIVQHDNSGAALATGMALGMMAGGGGRDVHHYHYAPTPAPVVQRVYVNKTYVRSAPAAAPAPVAAPAPRQYASRSVQTTSSGLKKR